MPVKDVTLEIACHSLEESMDVRDILENTLGYTRTAAPASGEHVRSMWSIGTTHRMVFITWRSQSLWRDTYDTAIGDTFTLGDSSCTKVGYPEFIHAVAPNRD